MVNNKPNKYLKFVPSDYIIYILKSLNVKNDFNISPNKLVPVNEAYLLYMKNALPNMKKSTIMNKYFTFKSNAQRTKFYQTGKTALFDAILQQHKQKNHNLRQIKKELTSPGTSRPGSPSGSRSPSPSGSPSGSRSPSPSRSRSTSPKTRNQSTTTRPKTRNQSTSTKGMPRKYTKRLKLHTFNEYMPKEFFDKKLKKHDSAMIVHTPDNDINVPKPLAKLIRQQCRKYDPETKRYTQFKKDGSEDMPVYLEFTY